MHIGNLGLQGILHKPVQVQRVRIWPGKYRQLVSLPSQKLAVALKYNAPMLLDQIDTLKLWRHNEHLVHGAAATCTNGSTVGSAEYG